MADIVTQETWYHNLLKDLRTMAVQGIVELKWKVGKRMLAEEKKFGLKEYGSRRVETVAKDLNISSSDLWKCIQFAKKYPSSIKELQNTSWHDIVKNFLPEKKKEKTKQKTQKTEFTEWEELLEWHNLEQPEIKKIVVHHE